ncbi:hypothetical protein HanIR_Chr15g0757891 [Helianthus annuus]|nr:hypothetical protein HanIR_Chr15g0757891 [Helianthus annuus]
MLFRILLFFERGVLIEEREKGGVGGTAPAFLSTLLGFRHYVQICHFVPITRRQVIARVGFRHCVQILNYLGFRRTRFVACRLWYRSCRILYSAFPIEFGSCLKPVRSLDGEWKVTLGGSIIKTKESSFIELKGLWIGV